MEALPSLQRELKRAEERIHEQERQLEAGSEGLAQLSERTQADLEEKAFANEKLVSENNELQMDVTDMRTKLKVPFDSLFFCHRRTDDSWDCVPKEKINVTEMIERWSGGRLQCVRVRQDSEVND